MNKTIHTHKEELIKIHQLFETLTADDGCLLLQGEPVSLKQLEEILKIHEIAIPPKFGTFIRDLARFGPVEVVRLKSSQLKQWKADTIAKLSENYKKDGCQLLLVSSQERADFLEYDELESFVVITDGHPKTYALLLVPIDQALSHGGYRPNSGRTPSSSSRNSLISFRLSKSERSQLFAVAQQKFPESIGKSKKFTSTICRQMLLAAAQSAGKLTTDIEVSTAHKQPVITVHLNDTELETILAVRACPSISKQKTCRFLLRSFLEQVLV